MRSLHRRRGWIGALGLLAACHGAGPSSTPEPAAAEPASEVEPTEAPETIEESEPAEPHAAADQARSDGPTAEQLAAWDRASPQRDAPLNAFDQQNFEKMQARMHDLECFRRRAIEHGEQSLSAEPGSKADDAWFHFKRSFVMEMDTWQKQMFADDLRVIEKSKYIGPLLEAHEVVMHHLLRAYNEQDRERITKVGLMWEAAAARFDAHTTALGLVPRTVTDAHCVELRKRTESR